MQPSPLNTICSTQLSRPPLKSEHSLCSCCCSLYHIHSWVFMYNIQEELARVTSDDRQKKCDTGPKMVSVVLRQPPTYFVLTTFLACLRRQVERLNERRQVGRMASSQKFNRLYSTGNGTYVTPNFKNTIVMPCET